MKNKANLHAGRQKKKKIDLARIVAVLVILLAIIHFYLNVFFPKLLPFFLRPMMPIRSMNILVMGTDVVYDAKTNKALSKTGLTDTLILCRILHRDGKINLLSIPRDTKIYIEGYGISKINKANLIGGPKFAVRVIQDITQVPIDGYITINPGGLIRLVDLVGGIEVEIDKDMHYVDKAGHLYIDLKAGKRILSGEEAHGYIRYRLDTMGDIKRVERQQNFLKELLKKMAQPSMLMRIPWVFNIMRENIDTDLSLREVMSFGNFARTLQKNGVEITTLPGSFSDEGRTSYWIPDIEKVKEVTDKYFGKGTLQ